jgi:hypothetical protein
VKEDVPAGQRFLQKTLLLKSMRFHFPLPILQRVSFIWLTCGITRADPVADVEPLVIDLEAREIGYYHVPTYMADQSGDLVFQVPLRALIAIDSWIHIFMVDVVFGLFSRGARFEKRLRRRPGI